MDNLLKISDTMLFSFAAVLLAFKRKKFSPPAILLNQKFKLFTCGNW